MATRQTTPPASPATWLPYSMATLPIMVPGRLRPTLVMSSSSSPVMVFRFSTYSRCIWATMLQPPPKVKQPN